MKIIVDAMGGDHAPKAVVQGVCDALDEWPMIHITLVGREEAIRSCLIKKTYDAARLTIVDAPDVVQMDDPATIVLRRKRRSSIAVGMELLKQDGYCAFISAGNTGAVVAAATVFLGMLPGVERPAIGLVIPTLRGCAFLIDVGANPAPKPEHLCQSALMANVYVKEVMGIADPRVALLNIGEEATKGSDFVKTTFHRFQTSVPGFIGNIEPNEIFNGKADCIVCDGFVGNVVIKISEGLMEAATKLVKREIKKSPLAMLGVMLMKKRLLHVRALADYTEYGGAPLLGVNGVVMICHGRSSPKAIKTAIRATMREINHNCLSQLINAVETAPCMT